MDTNHPFNNPRWVGSLGLHGYTIIQGNPKVGATADQEGDWVRVGGMLRQQDGGAFHRVCATSQGARDGTGDVGKDLDGVERDWV